MGSYEKKLREFLLQGDRNFLPHISIDCVIFGFHDNQLKVLLLKWKDQGSWSVPGGFVKRKESLDASAKRVLKERTGLKDIFLRQFQVFGDPHRERGKKSFKIIGTSKSWIMDRFITVGYWALVEFSKVTPRPDWLSDECQWWDVQQIPSLIYDHNSIVTKALEALRLSLNDQPVGYNLLPQTFTMPELQRLYETILGVSLDRRNFQKKMLALDVLERLPERKTGGAHKAPFLYKFDKKKYERAMQKGLSFGFQ
ncbi:NUDIX domain-containing protein [Chryseolinea sp. H1M3-3]|uniref:NUDIX hydrolase n=1 Tax=Chryseolinea sp. H1M3-3 TaxID=3034144 RepID=UPI0023ECEF58|nr:NUDIX domain-containing protein [Chryseolinea sp. H1M3-3]